MFLVYKRKQIFINLIIEILLMLCLNGLLIITRQLTVAANGTSSANNRPFLQIEKRTITRLTITEPHIPHYLSCIATIEETYDKHNAYYFVWYRNADELTRRNGFHTFANGTLLLPTNERASGVYHCEINANETAVLSESITVEFPVLKRVVAVSNVTAINDMSYTLNCPVISVPPANITWNFGNVLLTKYSHENRFIILTNGSLVLRSLTPEFAGKYKCLAHNQYAPKKRRQFTWTLNVDNQIPAKVMPLQNTQLIPHLQNTTQYIPNGTKLELRCAARFTNITIEWWHQRTLNAIAIKVHNNSEVLTIDVTNVTVHDGYYTCATKTDRQRYLVIITVPPTILEELPTYDGQIAATYNFRCRALGNPRPTISWYHNGAPINSSYRFFINGSSLTINTFDPEETGIYQCFARNIAGEVYSEGEIRFRNRPNETISQNPLHNIACYPHSFNTINVTFESNAMGDMYITFIMKTDPYNWKAPHSPVPIPNNSYMVLSSQLPVYSPFQLITRVLRKTEKKYILNQKHQHEQRIMQISLRSQPITCCTQGMLLHLVHLGNNTFVTWSRPELLVKKYFILQFSINHTHPHPRQLLAQTLTGTTQQVELNAKDVLAKLTAIQPLNETFAKTVLQRVERKFNDIEVRAEHLETDEHIYNIIVTANVTGILMANFSRIKMRVLIITTENENLKQDFRYVQWKIIDNDTSELTSTPFRLKTVESRLLVFHFLDNFNGTCVRVCKLSIGFPIISKEIPECENIDIVNSHLLLSDLRPATRYNLQLQSCTMHIFYGQLDVQTLPDPPGTISKQRVTRQNGLKLSWDPPIQPNGRVHHYNILWTLGNETHEANVLECSVCYYKFPNINETAKINITVRVVGETGVGAPVYIDLRNINHHTLEIERSTSNTEVYSGIAIGTLLSTFCVFFFALLIIIQRKRFKARQQGPTHLSTTTDIHFGNLSNTTMPGDSAGGLSGSTIQQDCHEMQTLIPKSRRNIILLAETRLDQQVSLHPNGNGNMNNRNIGTTAPNARHNNDEISVLNDSILSGSITRSGLNSSQLPLCTSTPERESKPFFIAFKQQQTPPNAVAAPSPPPPKHSSSTAPSSRQKSAIDDMLAPASAPNTLSLMVATNAANLSSSKSQQQQQRSGSLTSTSSTGNSSNSSKKSQMQQQQQQHPHQFHTNYSKHSNSIDGICLLAEEESSATLTPTAELDIHKTTLTNGGSSKNSLPPSKHIDTSNNGNNSNNNNTRMGNDLHATAATIHSTKHLPRTQQSQQFYKVPAIDGTNTNTTSTTSTLPHTAPNKIANAAHKSWSPNATTNALPLQPPTTAKTKKSSSNANNKLPRRPNVDPNG